MKICDFSEVKQEIAQNIKDQRLIPILGSGFSCKCQSRNGSVPSGKKMMEDMVGDIKRYSPSIDTDQLGNKSFAQISTYYHKRVPLDARRQYIRDNFTNVILPNVQKDFLLINWLYIYTLNMDDAIEKNSDYDQVVLSNKEVELAALSDYRCTIKLHGDANSYLLYKTNY